MGSLGCLGWRAALAAATSLFLVACAGSDGSGPDLRGAPATAGTEETGTIEVREQDGDGTGAVIDEVVLIDEGYVALYADGGGAPGELLGASELLAAGSHRAVEVAFDPALTGPTTVLSLIHI